MSYKNRRMNPKSFDKSQIKFYLYLVPLGLFMVLPIIYIFNHAFKPLDELMAFPPHLFVKKPTLEHFRRLLISTKQSNIPITRYIFNSLFVSVITIVLSLFIFSMAGFALSKMKFRGRKAFFEINNLALMFVPVAVQIRYLTFYKIGILDTYWAHILPVVAMPVALFLLKQFIDQIPDALIEAARIDGASLFQTYRKIILPMIRPALATAAILVFQAVWNNLETSNFFVNREGLKTLSFYASTLAAQNTGVAGQGMAAAASLILFVPNLILFIIMQSSVMDTMAHSGLK